MAQDDDLTATDGLSDLWIDFDGIDRHDGHNCDVRFRIFRKRTDGPEEYVSRISFPVRSNDFYEMVVLGYEELINFLRQGLFVANIMRKDYRKSAEWMSQKPE